MNPEAHWKERVAIRGSLCYNILEIRCISKMFIFQLLSEWFGDNDRRVKKENEKHKNELPAEATLPGVFPSLCILFRWSVSEVSLCLPKMMCRRDF